MADYQGKATGAEIDMLPDIIAKVFPLTASYATKNNGTYEVGTSVTPSVTLSITRKGADVSSSATITASGTTIGADKKSWTAPSLSSGSKSYSTKVSQGGQEVDLGSLTWSFYEYKYYGQVDSIASITSSVIKALTKAWANSVGVNNVEIKKGKYMICAVPTSIIPSGKKMMFQDVSSGGKLTSETSTGTITLSRVNNTAAVAYTYIYTNVGAGADGKLNVILIDA